MSEPATSETLSQGRLLGLLAALGLAFGCLLVLRPFLSALLWAAILVQATWPAYRVLRDRLGGRAGLAAAIMVAIAFVAIVLPLGLAAPTRKEDIEGLRRAIDGFFANGLPHLGDWAGRIPFIGSLLASYLDGVDLGLSGLMDLISPYAGTLAQEGLSLLLSIFSSIAELLIAVFLAFFLYRDGPAIALRLEGGLQRLAGDRARHLLTLTGAVTRGVVYGLLGTAVLQGFLTAFGLWISGVPRPVLLGLIAGCISILPIGAPAVWIPSALWLLGEGQTGWGIFLLAYGALGISSVDNFVRPWLIARGADLPLLLTLLGALGGVFAFGFLGLFLGPVLLAVGFTLLKDWADAGVVEGPGPG